MKITPRDGGEAVDHSRAYAGKPDSAAKLECDITGLNAAIEYTVGAQACLKGDEGCGKPVETTVTTPPPCKLRTC